MLGIDSGPVAIVVAALFGLLAGSFFNVCVYRLPRRCLSIVRPRSRCPTCLSFIRWYDNVPVFSYLLLLGKCRRCRTSISPRYPIVELLTALLFALAAGLILYSPPGIWPTPYERSVAFIVHASLIGAMIVATFVDWDFRIIPDEITIPGIPIAVGVVTAFPFVRDMIERDHPFAITNPHLASLAGALAGAAAGAGVIYAVGIVGKWIFRKDAMGFGDVKYLAMIGAVIGWKGVLTAFMISCVAGSIFGIASWIVTKDRYIAFGPYLSLGAVTVILGNDHVTAFIRWYQSLLR